MSKGLFGSDRVGGLKREVRLHDPLTVLIDLGDDQIQMIGLAAIVPDIVSAFKIRLG